MESIYSPGLPPEGGHPDEFDRQSGLRATGGDEVLLKELANLFLREYPAILENLRAAVQSGDAERVAYHAHALKGCISHFGADLATKTLLGLETQGRRGELAGAPTLLQELETALIPLLHQLQSYSKP